MAFSDRLRRTGFCMTQEDSMKSAPRLRRIGDPLKRIRSESGFTLIEMAIVLIIVGIMVSVVASVLPSLLQSAKIKEAKTLLEKADNAIQGYSMANHRLPYADSGTDGTEDSGTYVGNLPFRTLGLSSGNDVWQNPVKYCVYEDLTTTTSSDFCSTLTAIVSYTDPSKAHTTDEETLLITNQAYIIVSGGAKDLDTDGSDVFFDGLNEGTDVQFDDTTRIAFHGDPINNRYDDLIRAFSISELSQKNCTGGGGGGSDETSEVCDNGVDDDGDGYADCDDQDCFGVSPCGAGGENVVITTSTISSGVVNSDYAVTFQATGGTTPYEWNLTNDGGFSDFFLHTYTGRLSGTLEQCPGTYTIGVDVEDATPSGDGGPKTDSASFTLQVTSNLNISRTSGSGTDITWESPTQKETFTTNDSHLGEIQWSLDTGGATGFTVSATGSDTCTIEKDGVTSAGAYNFTLTATDAACPGNTDQLILAVTVTGGDGGGIGAPYSVDLAAEWHMDECLWNGTEGEVLDTGDAGLNGTALGAVSTGSGRICRSGLFDGTNDYLDMGDVLNDPLGLGSNQFTVAAWVKPFSLSSADTNHRTQNCFIAKASDADNDNLEIGINTDGTVHLYIDTSGKDTYADFGTSGSVPLNAWTFLAVTYDNGSTSVTINDTRYEDASTWSGGGGLDDAAGSPFTIGSSQHIDNYFHGQIDEVMVFSSALQQDEIQDIYEMTHACSGVCYTGPVAEYHMDETTWSGVSVADASVNGYDGTALHGADTTASGKVCRGGTFTDSGTDDVNDRVQIPYQVMNGTGDFTMGVWIRTAKNGQQAIVSGANGSQNNEFLLFLNNSTTLRTYLRGGVKSYSVASLADSSWQHIAWMRENDRETVYLNGQVIGTNTVSASALNIPPSGLYLGSEQDSVGGGWDSDQEFVGTMDEVYFYDRALSESEIETFKDADRVCN